LAFGTIDCFLLWRLTGGRVHATDATNASRTMLYDIHHGRWDEELLALFRIPPRVLPEVRDTASLYGTSAPDVLGRALPIAGLVGDQQGALVGQACFAPGMMKSTYGTGCFVLVNTGPNALTSRHRLLTTIAYRIDGATSYALEGSIFNAGTVVQWLRDEAGLIASASETATIAASLDDKGGAGGVYFVPAFTGLGAPHWDPHARGAILGLTRDSGRARVVRAGLESVAYQTADLISAFREDGVGAPAELRVDGGMATNGWFLQFLADVTGLAVERPVCGETTVLGAAFLAGLGSGVFSSLDEIKTAWSQDFLARPRMEPARRARLLAGWGAAVRRVVAQP
jgi:glycerol kinase